MPESENIVSSEPSPDGRAVRGFRILNRNYERLQEEANRQYRSAAAQLDLILSQRYFADDA